MFGSWNNLLCRRVDLDSAWAKDIAFELEDHPAKPDAVRLEPHWHSSLAWFTGLLRFALGREAWAIVLRSDTESMSLRQGIHVVGQFLELVPMPLSGRNSGISTVRLLGGMVFGRKRGTIHYSYEMRRRTATCFVLGDDVIALLASGAKWAHGSEQKRALLE